jgi:hypothetical protein
MYRKVGRSFYANLHLAGSIYMENLAVILLRIPSGGNIKAKRSTGDR